MSKQGLQVPIIQAGPAEKQKLLAQIPKLAGKRILVIGDVGLDEYILGEVRRISPEAPVPVLEVEREDLRLGMAGNVAQNIKSLGGVPILVSVIGRDSGAELLRQLLQTAGISPECLVVDENRPTTRKARVMAKHHHLCRIDYETRKFISPEIERQLLDTVGEALSSVDAMIIEDYAKGVLGRTLLQKLIRLAHEKNKKVVVDPHKTNPGDFYAGVDLLKPNFDEAVALSGLNYDDLRDHPDKVIEVGQALQKKTGAKEIVMTRSKEGMTIFSGDKVVQVPTFARQVFDVTGAGDTVIAALTLGLVSGLPLTESCMLANFAAGVVVGQVGCVPCTTAELKAYIESTD